MADLEGNGTPGNCPLNLLPTLFRDFLLYVLSLSWDGSG